MKHFLFNKVKNIVIKEEIAPFCNNVFKSRSLHRLQKTSVYGRRKRSNNLQTTGPDGNDEEERQKHLSMSIYTNTSL